MITFRRSRMKGLACAPAVVVLATIVNAAAHDQMMMGPPAPPDLSWAVKGGATHSAQSARVFIARQAATTIHSMDRFAGAVPVITSLAQQGDSVPTQPAPATHSYNPALQPARSTHQHSAP